MNNEIYWETPSELAAKSLHLPFASQVLKLHNNYSASRPYAYQGTSLELVMKLMETGKFPFGLYQGNFYFQKNGEQDSYSIMDYAHLNARSHYILNYLGFSPESTMEFKNWVRYTEFYPDTEDDSFYKEKLLEEGGKFNLTRNKLESIIRFIRSKEHFSQRKGVIISFSERIQEYGIIEKDPADEDAHYLQVDDTRRVLMDCVSSIECEGRFEWEFFEDLKNKIGK